MNGWLILIGCVLVVLLINSFSSKNNKETKEEKKEEDISENNHQHSSYINNYHHESEYDGYPKVIKSKRKGEEGMLVLIEKPGAKGRLIYGRRDEDEINYGRRSGDR